MTAEFEPGYVVACVKEFLESPEWWVPIASFVDENCSVFEELDNADANRFEWTATHTQYCELLDSLLQKFIASSGLTSTDVLDAVQLGQGPSFEQLLAADDFVCFKKVMIARNQQLDLEALMAFKGAERPSTSALVSSFDESELEKAIRMSTDDAMMMQRLMAEEQAQLERAIALSMALEEELSRRQSVASTSSTAASSSSSSSSETTAALDVLNQRAERAESAISKMEEQVAKRPELAGLRKKCGVKDSLDASSDVSSSVQQQQASSSTSGVVQTPPSGLSEEELRKLREDKEQEERVKELRRRLAAKRAEERSKQLTDYQTTHLSNKGGATTSVTTVKEEAGQKLCIALAAKMKEALLPSNGSSATSTAATAVRPQSARAMATRTKLAAQRRL